MGAHRFVCDRVGEVAEERVDQHGPCRNEGNAAAAEVAAVAMFNVAAVRAAPRPAKIIGFQQMFFGLAAVIVTAIAVLASPPG